MRTRKILETEYAEYVPLDETLRKNNLVSQSPPEKHNALFLKLCFKKQNHTFSEGGAESVAKWQEVCHETKFEGESITKDSNVEAMWRKLLGRQLCLPRLQFLKKVTLRLDGAQVPRLSQFILDALAGWV